MIPEHSRYGDTCVDDSDVRGEDGMLSRLNNIHYGHACIVRARVGARAGAKREKWWEYHHCGVPDRVVAGPPEMAWGGGHLVLYKLAGFCNDGINGLEGLDATCCLCHRGSQGVPARGRSRRPAIIPTRGTPWDPSAALRPDT
jgi:hypothetical protein